MAADQRRPTGEHPDPETLLAYHEGALPEAEADRVQEHLVHCEECAQAVLDFAAFPDLEPPSEEHRVTPAELRSRWRDLQAAIARRERPWWQRHHVLLPLAATFFAAAVGLAIWGAGMHERLAELEAPLVDLGTIAELRSTDAVSRGAEAPTVVRPGAVRTTFVLQFTSSERYAEYRLGLEGSEGVVIPREPVRWNPEGYLVVSVLSRQLPSGSCRFELFGWRDGEWTHLATYELEVRR